MSHDELVSKLREVHWVETTSLWWLVYVFIAVLLLLLYFFLIKKSKLYKEVNNQLKEIEIQYLAEKDGHKLRLSISALLRRIVYHKQPSVKKDLSLIEMQPYLEKILPKNKHTINLIYMIEKDRYHPHPLIDGEGLLNLSKKQIRKCRL